MNTNSHRGIDTIDIWIDPPTPSDWHTAVRSQEEDNAVDENNAGSHQVYVPVYFIRLNNAHDVFGGAGGGGHQM